MKELVDFFFELGQLKRVKRSGWWLLNIKDPESVAEHSWRAAAIGYFLAKLEKVDENKVVLACLFNDLHEARINDLHKVGHRYIDFKKAESDAFKEQLKDLPEGISKDLKGIFGDFQNQTTKEGIVARDADLLENAVQAKEYIDKGYKDAGDWIKNIKKLLKTGSAIKLLDEIEKTSSNDWWKGLKKINR